MSYQGHEFPTVYSKQDRCVCISDINVAHHLNSPMQELFNKQFQTKWYLNTEGGSSEALHSEE